jgi:ligand-binding SRPBCC domain-containing protein
MKLHRIETRQRVPISIEEAWSFYSNPSNLAQLTPKDIGFEITGDLPDEMYAGQILTYNVRPLAGIKMSWATRILEVEPQRFFIDDQLVGPYAIWHHQHHFHQVEGGTEVHDIVHYALPWYALGFLGHSIAVKPKLKEIFSYREQRTIELFGEI